MYISCLIHFIPVCLQDQRQRDIVTTMGAQDVPLEDKMVTIVYGTDLINVNYINFAAMSKDVAKVVHELVCRCKWNVKVTHTTQHGMYTVTKN